MSNFSVSWFRVSLAHILALKRWTLIETEPANRDLEWQLSANVETPQKELSHEEKATIISDLKRIYHLQISNESEIDTLRHNLFRKFVTNASNLTHREQL